LSHNIGRNRGAEHVRMKTRPGSLAISGRNKGGVICMVAAMS
jgi:hypothetical protein